MQFSLETLASLATIIGTIIAVLALFQSREWLAVASLGFAVLSIAGFLYARRERLVVDSASMPIEGYSVDSLNIANLRRKVSRALVVQEAIHDAVIDGEDLKVAWTYSGYCKKDNTSAMDFSIDSDSSTPFSALDCAAYDLGRDPDMSRPIRPLLVGPDGISKKLSVPFLEPLFAGDSFRILLKCSLPRCLKTGRGYYTSTLSFAQAKVRRCTVTMTFRRSSPQWLRVYQQTKSGEHRLLKTLAPTKRDNDFRYEDVMSNVAGRSVRVYAFWRDTI